MRIEISTANALDLKKVQLFGWYVGLVVQQKHVSMCNKSIQSFAIAK